METIGDIVKDALTEITVLGAEAPVEADDSKTGIRYLNRLMAALETYSIDLGYTKATGMGDPFTVSDAAIESIVPMLASKLWTQYSQGKPMPMELAMRAKAGLDTLLMLTVNIGAAEYPDTLPIGSGNEGDADAPSHFYSDLQSTILAETTGSVGLEESTP